MKMKMAIRKGLITATILVVILCCSWIIDSVVGQDDSTLSGPGEKDATTTTDSDGSAQQNVKHMVVPKSTNGGMKVKDFDSSSSNQEKSTSQNNHNSDELIPKKRTAAGGGSFSSRAATVDRDTQMGRDSSENKFSESKFKALAESYEKMMKEANGDSSGSSPPPNEKKLSLDVIELTSKNFASTITTSEVWLIEFYTPWCSHCKNFQRSYANVARAFHSNPNEKIRVAKVNCEEQKALTTRFNIQGFPSFVLVSGFEVYEFDELRSEASLMNFARGGYKKKDPVPIMVSPMGPMGLLQGTLIYLGMNVMGLFEWVHEQYGVSPILAGMSLIFLMVFGGMISIVLLTIIFTPKEKVD